MTDEELAEIEARAAVATPGPWALKEVSGPRDFGGIHSGAADVMFPAQGDVCWERADDAVFCAHARADIPRLLAEVRRLRAIEAALRWQIEHAGCAASRIGETTYECDAAKPCGLCRLRGERYKTPC